MAFLQLAERVYYILTSAWGFQRCSFRQIGQCESLDTWNERQTGSTFFLYVLQNEFGQFGAIDGSVIS